MVPYTNDLGLRDWRASATPTHVDRRASRWPWLVLLVCVLLALVLRGLR